MIALRLTPRRAQQPADMPAKRPTRRDASGMSAEEFQRKCKVTELTGLDRARTLLYAFGITEDA